MFSISVDRVVEHHFIDAWLDGKPSRDLVIVDLGMNEGDFSREMKRRYPSATVIGAEANPHLAEKLGRDNSFKCFNYAIAAEDGEVKFGIDPDNSQASSLVYARDSLSFVTVEGVRFEQFLRLTALADTEIDLLKVDIEGAELGLFEKTPDELLQQARQVCVEFHVFQDPAHLPRVKAILERMTALGFFCIDFTTNYQDVLMLNEKRAGGPLGPTEKQKLSVLKYARGANRKLKKMLGATA